MQVINLMPVQDFDLQVIKIMPVQDFEPGRQEVHLVARMPLMELIVDIP